jgi:hypothetical protein
MRRLDKSQCPPYSHFMASTAARQRMRFRFSLSATWLLRIVIALACFHFLTILAVFTTFTVRGEHRNLRALMGMMLGLYLAWIIPASIAQWRLKPVAEKLAERRDGSWRLRFFLLCVAMAMIEEAVTTLMTNAAPLFGVKVGQVYITASSNYWDVVLGHSLIVIVPTFLAWTWLLNRYRFRPVQVLLLYGCTGTLMESFSGGPQQIGMWILVYGLMVYLPACTVPDDRPGRKPLTRHYLAAVFVPFLAMPLCIPMLFGIRAIRPSAAIDFPPIQL